MDASQVDWQADLVLTISIIGFLSLFNQFHKLVRWVWCVFFRPPKELTSYGSWALVTGCTDGVGKALAFELASKGVNLVLVSRNSSKLQQTLNEIREEFGEATQMKIIVIDFAKTRNGEEIKEVILREIEGLDVGILVNNAAAAGSSPRFFHEFDSEEIDEMVSVNIYGTTWVTRAVLHAMLKKQKGFITNIGSGATVALPSYPLCDVYAATKAYMAMLSRSLNVEYQQLGIHIQCQTPLFIATKMTSIKRSSFFIPSPNQYSKASIRWIGYDLLCVPYWPHSLLCCIIDAVPDSLVNWLVFRYFISLRKKKLQKESMRSSLKNKT